MTAVSITAQANRRIGTLGAYRYAEVPIDSTADTALAAITTSSTVRDVLVILDACIARDRQTTANGIGRATVALTSTAPSGELEFAGHAVQAVWVGSSAFAPSPPTALSNPSGL